LSPIRVEFSGRHSVSSSAKEMSAWFPLDKAIAASPRENTRIGARMRLVRTNLLDLLPRDFPKWVKPEIFGLQSVEESG
jgi:hypothetical protein